MTATDPHARGAAPASEPADGEAQVPENDPAPPPGSVSAAVAPAEGVGAGAEAVDAVPAPAAEVAPVEVTLRRAPKVGRFMAMGLLLGGIVSFVLAIISVGWSELTTSNTFWLTLLWTAPLGLGLGALVAFLLDRRSVAQAEKGRAAHEA